MNDVLMIGAITGGALAGSLFGIGWAKITIAMFGESIGAFLIGMSPFIGLMYLLIKFAPD